MTATLRIARMTSVQVLGLRRLLGLGLLAVTPAAIVYLSTSRASETSRLDTFAGVTAGFFFSVVLPVVALILAASALGDERRDQTLSFIVLRPVARTNIAAAKIVGAIAAGWAVTGIGAAALGAAMGLRQSDWGYLVPLVVGAAIATVAYTAVFVPLGFLTERATLAGLTFAFVFEGAVVGALPGMASLSPWRMGYSAFVALAPDEFLRFVPDFALGNVQPGVGGAVVKALVVCALGVALTTWILRHRDLA